MDGDEVNYFHLGKINNITVSGTDIVMTVKGSKKYLKLRAFTDNPNEVASQLAQEWGKRLTEAKEGRTKPRKSEAVPAIEMPKEESGDGDDDGAGFNEDEHFTSAGVS